MLIKIRTLKDFCTFRWAIFWVCGSSLQYFCEHLFVAIKFPHKAALNDTKPHETSWSTNINCLIYQITRPSLTRTHFTTSRSQGGKNTNFEWDFVFPSGQRKIEEQQVGDKKLYFMVFICCGNCLKGACETVKPLRAYISATFTDKTAHELLMSGVQRFKN